MAHYALVVDGIVKNVIVADEEFISTHEPVWTEEEERLGNAPPRLVQKTGQWVQTSYNMKGGVYYDPETNSPAQNQNAHVNRDAARRRKNYAGIGDTYDPVKDHFISPKPFDSWVLDNNKGTWKSPIPRPNGPNPQRWNEAEGRWDEVSYGPED